MAKTYKFQGRARAIHRTAESTYYVYHKTAVVTVFKDGSICLNNGGWRTNTTKLAMNQASNQDSLGFTVSQRDFEWFVQWQGQEMPYANNMILRRETVAA